LQETYDKFSAKYNYSAESLQVLAEVVEKYNIKKLGRLWAKVMNQAYVPEYLRGEAVVKSVPLEVCVYFDLVDRRTVVRLEGRSTAIIQSKLDAQWRHIKHIESKDLMRYAAMYRKFKRG
jgi:hypothetical protein